MSEWNQFMHGPCLEQSNIIVAGGCSAPSWQPISLLCSVLRFGDGDSGKGRVNSTALIKQPRERKAMYVPNKLSMDGWMDEFTFTRHITHLSHLKSSKIGGHFTDSERSLSHAASITPRQFQI